MRPEGQCSAVAVEQRGMDEFAANKSRNFLKKKTEKRKSRRDFERSRNIRQIHMSMYIAHRFKRSENDINDIEKGN